MTGARIVVLVPHHDDTPGLLRSLASIREAEPVDVLVVDDGSPTPPRCADLQAALTGPGTVVVERLVPNRGIAGALNHGLRWCQEHGYDVVGRLDAGDRNRAGRLGQQLAVLDADPTLGMVGTWVQARHPDGHELFVFRPPAAHDAIRRALVWGNPMVHPSVVMRTRVVWEAGGYPEHLPAAEDFGLVAHLARTTRLANLPRILVDKEFDPASISATRRRDQVRSRLRVIAGLPEPAWRRGLGLARNAALLATSREATTWIKQRLR